MQVINRIVMTKTPMKMCTTQPQHIRQSTPIAVFKRSLDTSTPSDIATSALETIIFYCFMGYISALTYYLLAASTVIVIR